jgi:type III restriction enzyme
MQLKKYQNDTLNVLQSFFEDCRVMGADSAFHKITSQPDLRQRLGQLHSDYMGWASIPNTPRICLKIPTGGGKTIVAAHSIKIVSETWLEREFPIVLWFCPSDTIRKQTAEALKNPRHPYREVLDEQFNGKVRVFDLDEKFNIRPADTQNNCCVIVSTIQAFRQSNTDKYNVYKHNEELEPHFTHITPEKGMELLEDGKIKYSFANLLFHNRPIEIVDEAHNAVSDLTKEVHGRLNPSAIIELTATPQLNNNTLYNVFAMELKDEEMIKLPIALTEHLGAESAIDESIAKRAELEKAAENETDYIRPILLFQAQDKNGEWNVDKLKSYLIDTANIPENEIAIATGDQHELDGINIFAKDCPIKYIITVEALKEGWDCSFAYVLCSLANVKSDTAIAQLLGRVMRMPYARTRKISALNKAYAYVLSTHFGEATSVLVDKLIEKGFDGTEAPAVIEQQPATGLFGRSELNKVDIAIVPKDIPATIKVEGKTLVFTSETTKEDVDIVAKQLPEQEAYILQNKYANYSRTDSIPSPATLGEKFVVPKLMVSIQGQFVFADPDVMFENFDWNIFNTKPELGAEEFNIEKQGNGFIIDIDGNRLGYNSAGKDQLTMPFVDVVGWTNATIVSWLDRQLKQDDIPQGQMVEWLRQVVEYLTDNRGIKLSELMLGKYVLARKLEHKIESARAKAKESAFQTYLFKPESRIMLDFDNGFTFAKGMYDGLVYYQGRQKFNKHFLGTNKIPMMDGDEEISCAQALDIIPEIKYWLRNVSRHPSSFRLPTSTDYFYPDFVALLNDGRILVVEYKGGHLIDSKDTKEKALIGELWEKQSAGKGLFMIVEKSKDGLNSMEQIKKKIGVL